MKRLITILCLTILTSISQAQITNRYYVSTSQNGERFEIVQSPIKRACTYKLDKYTGTVSVMVETADNFVAWENVEVERIDRFESLSEPDKINYQIFMSGIMAADCFLLHVRTGMTWILVERKDKTKYFQIMGF